MKYGYIPISRKFFEHSFWKQNRVFSLAEAWLDLIRSARFEEEPEKLMIGMSVLVINRGEIRGSLRYFAQRWKWSKDKVSRYLKLLENETMIRRETRQGESIIILLNYNSFNVLKNGNYKIDETPNEADSRQERDTTETPPRHRRDKLNKENKENKENNTLSASVPDTENFLLTKKKRKLSGKRLEKFLIFWDKFNYKKGKAEAADSWLDIPVLTESICSQIFESAEKEAEERPELISLGRTPKMAQGWLTAERWEDEYTKPETKKKEVTLEAI